MSAEQPKSVGKVVWQDLTVANAEAAVQQANAILLAMNQILEDMLDLETYNELLDIVRSIIEEQKALIKEKKKEQKKQVLDLLN